MIKKRKCLSLLALTLIIFLIMTALLGCSSTGKENNSGNNASNGSSGNNAQTPSVNGKNTTLPVYPGSARIDFYEMGSDVYVDIYKTSDSLEAVINYFRNEFADWEGVSESEGAYGEGDYTFEINYADEKEKNFILTLSVEEDEGTLISFLAAGFYYN